MSTAQYLQEPVAIVGFACRLPGGNTSPQKLWDFLEQGQVASNKVPESRFNIKAHYDGSQRPGTMRPPGGMFMENIDLADFDASFFEISGGEATSMDPNHRQMLEVVYEGLENAGFPLEKLDGAPVGCFVGSFMSDYGDMQNRDPTDRPPNYIVGSGRTIMANRISYFLNIKGPSITVDTACSGSLVGVDFACRSLHTGEIDTAIVATSNIFLNPEQGMDQGSVGQAYSPTALCHTFDVDADGYVKAEAVSCVILKKLSSAIRDRDPIRAIIRGTASTSNGRTPGIANPNSESQAAAIRLAYACAGITDYNETAYLECHGTGTQAGDPTEVRGAGSVFAATRDPNKPLIIGSIKGNVGHAEPAAGISGLMKTIMAMEKGVIPGNPLFIKPNPKIDFIGNRMKASRTAVAWPDEGFPVRRASINGFGFGGSNCHAVIEQPSAAAQKSHTFSYKDPNEEDDFEEEEESARPYTLILSANDAASLKANIQALCNHLVNPRIKVSLPDLAYTLSERRTRLWHRAFVTTHTTELGESDFVMAKKNLEPPKIGIVFTGQGAQWPQMGKDLLEFFPWTRSILEELDQVLQAQADPPAWSLVKELTESRTAEHLRQPEFSQPLVTALQICIMAVLESWGVKPSSVVGHSSGEIAAAYTAGLLDRAGAIKAAFYRGRAAVNRKDEVDTNVGMLAVGLSAEDVSPFLEKYIGSLWIACFNSPGALTISGKKPALEALAEDIKAAGYFARLLQVDLAYHSELMSVIGEEYNDLLDTDEKFKPLGGSSNIAMFSSVTASKKDTAADASYWKTNMVSPVRFSEALTELIKEDAPNMLIEIGPSGALAGPVSQVLKSTPVGADIQYCASWSRGANASKSLFDVAGRLFLAGAPIDMSLVNEYDTETVRTIIDLPNYSWNHSVKYWYENAASKDWRFKKFHTHDMIGSKILGTTWENPTWRKQLNLADIPWLRDHKMGPDVLIPGAGLVTFAVEAMFQKYCALNPDEAVSSPNDLAYRFRNVKLTRAIMVDEGKPTTILLSLNKVPGSKDWHEFKIRTSVADVIYEHTTGLVRIQDPVGDEGAISGDDLAPLKYPQSSKLWYKVQQEIGLGFGPEFQKIKTIESVSGSRKCRSILSLEPPKSKWDPQSYYPIHPAVLDGCTQTITPGHAEGERSTLKDVLIPVFFEDIVINKMAPNIKEGLSLAESVYSGRGRKELHKSWLGNIGIYDPQTGALIMRVKGIAITRLDVEPKPDPHTFQTVTWKPDISLLTQDQLMYLSAFDDNSAKLDSAIDLVAYKKPTLKVLEISLDDEDNSSLWFQNTDIPARAAYSQYDFASINATSLVSVQTANESKKNTAFHLITPGDESLGLPATGPTYDLAIVKLPKKTEIAYDEVIKNLKSLLKPDGHMLLVHSKVTFGSKSSDLITTSEADYSPESPKTPSETSSGSPSNETLASSLSSAPSDLKLAGHEFFSRQKQYGLDNIFSSVKEIFVTPDSSSYLYSNTNTNTTDGTWHLTVARFDETTPTLSSTLEETLKASGWTVSTSSIEKLATVSSHGPKSVVLVLDELSKPVLTQISEKQWEALQQFIGTGTRLLWVTKGAQTSRVTDPDNAMVQGLFRVIRREDPVAKLTTLDVQSATSPATAWAIDQVLQKVQADNAETEYAERDGILHVQRIVPDIPINDFKAAESGKGLEPIVKDLRATEAPVQLQTEKIGSLDSLTWSETSVGSVPIQPGMIEIETMAVGVNFKPGRVKLTGFIVKDVAIAMGIVPENEYLLGCECAGVVKRVAPGVTKFKVGDRVAANWMGCYANRLQCPPERAHIIPSSMSFEDAATIPVVYLTALYSLYHLGNLQEGQSVLIHSAAGGVGIAAIQLAKYKKADIFVTVSTKEKREFLANNFGIPENRMFNSRNTRFAEEIRRETNGRGVDVILNSLTGELLDETWRLTADGGTMVEIGKQDIVERNTLAMEPFDRNCSYRAIDLSYTQDMTDQVVDRLYNEVFDLVEAGHIGPIHPITTFGFDQVIDALSFMRSGKHIGKIVISNQDKGDVQVPIRPAVRKLQLDPEASYLIVGGLKGLCGSVAVHMAIHGARHIIVMSRSGTNDEASARVILNCEARGCTVIEAKGDAGDLDFVRSVFRSARPKRIAGVIQGAMVLRDKPYEMMTHSDYHTAIHAKIAGTWNLHNVAQLEQSQPLDFFTMLSSISGVVGNKGQANYAAANTFLDSFATYRQGLGLRANTVDLGAIQDVGYMAEQGSALEERFDQTQWTPINEGMLRRIMSYSFFQQEASGPINASSSAQLITGLAYPLPADADLAGESRFGYLFNSQESSSAGSDSGSGDQADQGIKAFRMMHTSGAEAAVLAKAAVVLMQAQLTKLLRLETEMEPGKPLMAYGLDSLAAVELRGWVRQKLGAELSTLEINNASSLINLCEKLVSKLPTAGEK
ncbi:Acyl transferase acyl hydrolase lysophospholipase protein [Rutstroemia sp. NJR-2017a BVV2]|nr:Acyl transferase acyl hydrolase lysophospholipase protein [Rutstroemia sp. NJR-2017a BVV2]